MSYRWPTKYLPEKFKDENKAPRVARRATPRRTTLLELSKPPNEKSVEVGKYVNMNHILYTVKRPLQEKVEKAAKKLKTTPDALIQNVIEEKLRKIVLFKQKAVEASSWLAFDRMLKDILPPALRTT